MTTKTAEDSPCEHLHGAWTAPICDIKELGEGREQCTGQWAEARVTGKLFEILKWSLYTFRALEFCGPVIVFGQLK